MVQALKDGKIRLPWFEPQDTTNVNYDYLALREDPRQVAGNNTIIYIIKKPGVPDDTAHATNFAVSGIWDMSRTYPKFNAPAQPAVDIYQSPDIITPDNSSAYYPREAYTEFI